MTPLFPLTATPRSSPMPLLSNKNRSVVDKLGFPIHKTKLPPAGIIRLPLKSALPPTPILLQIKLPPGLSVILPVATAYKGFPILPLIGIPRAGVRVTLRLMNESPLPALVRIVPFPNGLLPFLPNSKLELAPLTRAAPGHICKTAPRPFGLIDRPIAPANSPGRVATIADVFSAMVILEVMFVEANGFRTASLRFVLPRASNRQA